MKRSGTTRTVLWPVLVSVCLLQFTGHALASDAQALCLSFVTQKLSGSGGVFTNFLPSGERKQWASGHSVLSESQGLMLAYFACTGSEESAARTICFVRDHLDTGQLISYRLDEDGGTYPVNAAVDDLRLIGALLKAAEAFNRPDYRDLAELYGRRLYDTNVRHHTLVDFYDGQLKRAGGFATLCYSDFFTIKALSAYDERWLSVMENMRDIVLGGYLGDTLPLFHTRYNLEKQWYESENVPMVQSLISAYHLSQVGACPGQTPEYLKSRLREGRLYAVYDLDGNPLSDLESTAIYALCALLGVSEGDRELYRLAIDRMLPFQVTDHKSPVYGAFADAQTLQLYSFDNLLALLALEAGKSFR